MAPARLAQAAKPRSSSTPITMNRRVSRDRAHKLFQQPVIDDQHVGLAAVDGRPELTYIADLTHELDAREKPSSSPASAARPKPRRSTSNTRVGFVRLACACS
jgi:hypothetical protein